MGTRMQRRYMDQHGSAWINEAVISLRSTNTGDMAADMAAMPAGCQPLVGQAPPCVLWDVGETVRVSTPMFAVEYRRRRASSAQLFCKGQLFKSSSKTSYRFYISHWLWTYSCFILTNSGYSIPLFLILYDYIRATLLALPGGGAMSQEAEQWGDNYSGACT